LFCPGKNNQIDLDDDDCSSEETDYRTSDDKDDIGREEHKRRQRIRK